jgi:uncharacterized RDD family membrane protein YckC
LAAAVVNRLSLLLSLLLSAGGIAHAADVLQHNVVAQGDSERFWVGQVEQSPTDRKSIHTTVYYRPIGQDNKWQVLAIIPARIVSLASKGPQPAALLDDGTWMVLYADGGPVTMGPLPEPAHMVALAGGHDTWWAVGAVPGGITAIQPSGSTRPSTQSTSTTVSTRPATQPAVARLVLFSLQGNDWKPRVELPDSIPDAPSVSLAFLDENPWVADRDSDGLLHVRRLDGAKWAGVDAGRNSPDLTGFQLLTDNSLPRIWVQHQTGPDQLFPLNHNGAPTLSLPPIAASNPVDRTLAIATGKVRMVAVVNGKLVEQDFRASDGIADGAAFPLAVPQYSPWEQVESFVFMIVTAALFMAILGSVRQRAAMRGATARLPELNLAPVGRRFLAGLIDLAPILLTLAGLAIPFSAGQQNPRLMLVLLYLTAGMIYIAYNTIIETVAGRSLGKLLLGLRVVGFDGQPAKPAALILRNVLRIIEVAMFFLPALTILLLPLRQRAGDIAAGTLVISDKVKPEAETTTTADEPAGMTEEKV